MAEATPFLLPSPGDAATWSASYGCGRSINNHPRRKPVQMISSSHMGSSRQNAIHSQSSTPAHPHPAPEYSVQSVVQPQCKVRNPVLAVKRRVYSCTNCLQSIKNKWDWKRHERIHERLEEWECPDCGWICADARWFKSHHKQKHCCQDCPHSDEVKTILIQKEAWGCGFCAELLTDWDSRCNHVARHFERDYISGRIGRESHEWDHTAVIEGLLKRPELQERYEILLSERYPAGVIGLGYGLDGNMAPILAWEKSNTKDLMIKLQAKLDADEISHLLNLLLDRADAQSSFNPDRRVWGDDNPMRGDDVFDRDIELVHGPEVTPGGYEQFEGPTHMDTVSGCSPSSPLNLCYYTMEAPFTAPIADDTGLQNTTGVTSTSRELEVAAFLSCGIPILTTPEDSIGFGLAVNSMRQLESLSAPSTIDPALTWRGP
jgi:hypothetical protein